MDKGRGVVGRPAGPSGGPVGACGQLGRSPGGFVFFFFPFLLVLGFSFSVLFLFIFFSVLNHFKLFRHFIKMCLLHHNYPCNI